MQEKSFKARDMIIAIFCTLLAILCIVFYFLPAFNVGEATSTFAELEYTYFSGWEITRAAFTGTKVIGYNWDALMYIKDTYGFAIIIAGVLMPLSIVCSITTAVFAYIAWLKKESFKKFCFLFSLVGMIFQTISLILIWFLAIMTKEPYAYGYFAASVKGGMSYASFVSLILAFVIAIVACAYNFFIDGEDDEYEEIEDDEEEEVVRKPRKRIIEVDDDEYEEVVVVRRRKVAPSAKVDKPESNNEDKFVKVEKTLPSKTPTKSTTASKPAATRTTTTHRTTTKK